MKSCYFHYEYFVFNTAKKLGLTLNKAFLGLGVVLSLKNVAAAVQQMLYSVTCITECSVKIFKMLNIAEWNRAWPSKENIKQFILIVGPTGLHIMQHLLSNK